MNSLNFPCSLCKNRFRTGAELSKHKKIAHGPKPVAPARQVDQRIEGGRDHAAARPSLPIDPASAAADAATGSGSPVYDHGSEADAADYEAFPDGDDQQDGEADPYQLMLWEGFEALKKQRQEESYSLDLEVGTSLPQTQRCILASCSTQHGAYIEFAGSVVQVESAS